MSDISQIKLPDNTTYNINAKTVNGHTVGKDVPSSAVFTDQYVSQVSSATEDNNYRVLLSGTASDNTQTETVRKSSGLKFNPKYDAITMGYDRASGSAYGVCSLTQGSNIVASGQYSHGEGWWTIANHRSQHVFGEYNVADTSSAIVSNRGNYIEIVGNGTENSRSNARTLDWSGTETLAGSLLLAGTTSDIQLTGTGNYWYGTTTSLKTAVSSLEHDLSDLTPLEKTASGAIATFDDGSDLPMPKLEVAIEPQQDLHGYDNPWVGGAGKNKANLSTRASATLRGITSEVKADNTIVASGTSTGNGDIICDVETPFTMEAGETYTISLSGTDTRINQFTIFIGTSYRNVGVIAANNHSLTFTVASELVCNQVMLRASRDATININAKLQIEEGSTATAFEPYSNICPISGWDECNVTVVGKNILGGLPLANAIVNAGGTLDTTNKTVSFTHGNSQVNILENVKLKESTKYTFIITYSNGGNNNCLSLFYKTSGTRYPINLNNSSDTKTTIVYTTSAVTIDKLVLSWVLDASTKIYYEESGLFEGELTASDFEAYNGQTYNIQFKDGDNPLTVYGGTLDVVSGVLTVDRAYVDMGSLTWTYQSTQNVFSTNISGLKRGILICSNYKYTDVNTVERMNDGEIWDKGNAFNPTNVVVKDLRYTDTTAFKTAMNGVQLVYELATPITYQLTPTQVKSLLGVNNVWADTGDVKELIYFRNAKSTQAIKDIIDTTTAKDIAFTKYKGLPTNVQEAINQTYDNVIALNGNMADYYFERQSYNVDDYVRYEDPYYGGYNLYRCIERSDGGSFDYNKWFRTNIGNEFSEIRQSLSDLDTPTAVSTGVIGLGAIKCGKIILLTSFNTGQITANANETIWTLPRGLAPLTYPVQIYNIYGDTRLILDIDGTIKTTTALNGVYVRFTVMYIVS